MSSAFHAVHAHEFVTAAYLKLVQYKPAAVFWGMQFMKLACTSNMQGSDKPACIQHATCLCSSNNAPMLMS